MRKPIYNLILSIFVASISFVFIACGGGGGGGSSGGSRSKGGGGNTNPPPPDSYIFMIMQKADSGASFSQPDLDGTWNYHGLVSGEAPQKPGWSYGQVVISNGVITQVTHFYSTGGIQYSPLALNSNLTVDSEGIVYDPADTSFHGAMNSAHDLIVINKTDTGSHLLVLQKVGASNFTPNDLLGRWNNHCIISGDTQWLGWERGVLDFYDANSTFAFASYSSSDPSRTINNAIAIRFDLLADGTVLDHSGGSFQGSMSSDKNLMVGTIDDRFGGFKLCVIQRTNYLVNFSLNDLAYKWNYHGISTGDDPYWTGWFNGQLTVDTNGSITQISYDDSGGSTAPLALNSDIGISSRGILTYQPNSSFHGSMSVSGADPLYIQGDLIIATMN